ncbi:hypothetical protein EII17_09170 [Clostridiales bacterium COT073_COT-073]|nr:hypothetical protein EII17_09170 [Clostridiales bacterium COT073_COT-073]
MNREEILQKSRQEKKDEGVQFMLSRGYKIGRITFLVTCIILFIYHGFVGIHGHNLILILTLVMAYFTGETFAHYSYKKERILLILTVIQLLLTVFLLYFYISTTWPR